MALTVHGDIIPVWARTRVEVTSLQCSVSLNRPTRDFVLKGTAKWRFKLATQSGSEFSSSNG